MDDRTGAFGVHPLASPTRRNSLLSPRLSLAGASDGEGDAEEEVEELQARMVQQARDKMHGLSSIKSAAAAGGHAGESLSEIFVSDIPVHVEQESKDYMTAFQRVTISEEQAEHSAEIKSVCKRILEAAELRDKYRFPGPKQNWGGIDKERFQRRSQFERASQQGKGGQAALRRRPDPPFVPFPTSEDDSIWTKRSFKFAPSEVRAEFKDGVVRVEVLSNDAKAALGEKLAEPPSVLEFYDDLFLLMSTVHDAACKSTCYKRLKLLDSLYGLHQLLNAEKETAVQRTVPHRDFYNVRKVDTHIHHSAVMNQKHLLRFIKSKLKRCPSEVVIKRDGKLLTLSEVFRSLKLTAYDLSIDTLDMHADNTFHRFDRFNLKYNPMGESRLREIFLKSDNLLAGRYLAEISQEVFSDCEANKYVMLEPRISIYGRSLDEWENLANWYFTNRLASPNVRWMVQIPRLYSVYKGLGLVNNFQDMLTNIFQPLFAVTLDPSSNPELDNFLNQVTGFDCVDDESRLERPTHSQLPVPAEWDLAINPPYSYWIYYIYANIYSLNALRQALGLTTFQFRPHAGEAGDVNNLAATFLCADSINHGILLRKLPTLQYLYYLKQIGLALSPLSNNKLFLDYHSNPFPVFFARGLNVSLSTDDPLMLHITKEPLVEEYSVAAQVWKFSATDQCEIARNSVLQSGFEHPYKAHFLGDGYGDAAALNHGNNIAYTNVPDIRVIYRRERLEAEWAFVKNAAAA